MFRHLIERMLGSTMRPSPQPRFASDSNDEVGGNPSKNMSNKSSDVQIDNSEHVLVKIATLYAERLMNDICLVVDNVEYPAHRLILCASSEVFQVMLMNPQWTESRESRIELKETPACAQIFGEFIKYFYTGKIKINHVIITPLLALADKYNVKDLIDLCVAYMCGHIAMAAKHSQIITWYQYSLSLGHNVVVEACQNFIKWNFEQVAKSSDFGTCHPEVLARLLQWNDLVVMDEFTLFLHLVGWLEYQRQGMIDEGSNNEIVENDLECLVKDVMCHVRFPMMTPPQLAKLLMNPVITKYRDFFIHRMAASMKFHSGEKSSDEEEDDEMNNNLLYTPRLYTTEYFSSELTIDNFSTFPFYQTRTLVFFSHSGFAEHSSDKLCDWIIDFCPKGVWFPKSLLIVWQGTVELPESVLCTVRLSITWRNPTDDDLRVKIGVLVFAIKDGIEYVDKVVEKNFYFNKEDRHLNIDDIVPFDQLNLYWLAGEGHERNPSKYLIGPNCDTLKVQIVIMPLSDESSLIIQTANER